MYAILTMNPLLTAPQKFLFKCNFIPVRMEAMSKKSWEKAEQIDDEEIVKKTSFNVTEKKNLTSLLYQFWLENNRTMWQFEIVTANDAKH